jgi:hypothetical protein
MMFQPTDDVLPSTAASVHEERKLRKMTNTDLLETMLQKRTANRASARALANEYLDELGLPPIEAGEDVREQLDAHLYEYECIVSNLKDLLLELEEKELIPEVAE